MTFSYKYILLALSVILFFIFVAWFWSYSIDDAFVTFRYAENFVNGHGFVFNPGDAPVEGYSNFLWLLILSGAVIKSLASRDTFPHQGVNGHHMQPG